MTTNDNRPVEVQTDDTSLIRSELQKRVITHNVYQFFLKNLQICRICLETEDDSRGVAFLKPITIAIWTYLDLKNRTLPNMICTKCEEKIVEFMMLMELCAESNSFIMTIREELEADDSYTKATEVMDIKSEDLEPDMEESEKEMLDISESESLTTEVIEISNEEFVEEETLVDVAADDSLGSFTSIEEVVSSELQNSDSTLIMENSEKSNTFKMINDKFVCLFCGKSFNSKQSHATHVRISHTRPHTCPIDGCSKAFGLPTMVRRHMKQMHSQQEQILYTDKISGMKYEMGREEKSGKFECFHCGVQYSRKHHMDNHIRQIHEKADLKCKVCGKSFNAVRMKVHMKIHSKLFECNECGRRFVDRFILKRHLLSVHRGVNAYLCSQCGQSFASAQKLRRHVVKVHEQKWVKSSGTLPEDQKGFCKICGLRFLDKTKLIQHVKEHTLIHKCKICAKKFSSEVSLKSHETTHKDVEHPFHCSSCDSRYATKALLKSHFNKIHGAQQWLCTFCHKSLASARALDAHEKFHKGIKEYQCFLCEKEFVATRRLREHLIANHTESRYQCSACDVQCISQRGFEAHLKREHPELLEAQPNLNTYFYLDNPTHTNIMEKYHSWLKKLAKKRQKENKTRHNIGVEVIELENMESLIDNKETSDSTINVI